MRNKHGTPSGAAAILPGGSKKGKAGTKAVVGVVLTSVAAVACAYLFRDKGLTSAFLAIAVLTPLFFVRVQEHTWRRTMTEWFLVAGLAITLTAFQPTSKPVETVHGGMEAGSATSIDKLGSALANAFNGKDEQPKPEPKKKKKTVVEAGSP